MFHKHIQRIQNEFDDRFGLLQRTSMEIDCDSLPIKVKEQYIDKLDRKSSRKDDNKQYDRNEYNDDHLIVPRNRAESITSHSHENRYSPRHKQQYTTDTYKHKSSKDGLTNWNFQEDRGGSMTNDLHLGDQLQHNHSYYDRNREVQSSNYRRDNEQNPRRSRSRDTEYNTNFREISDRSYVRRSRSTDHRLNTELQRNTRPSNPFSNNNADNTFHRKKSSDHDYHDYVDTPNVSDSRLVQIIHRKSATATELNETGKKLQIADYRSHHEEIVSDNDESFVYTQRSNRDLYSVGNNKKINDFFSHRNPITDARQYIIEKEMQKFNEHSRSNQYNQRREHGRSMANSQNSSNNDFVSKRINDRHEQATIWSNRNRNDFPLSSNQMEAFELHNNSGDVRDGRKSATYKFLPDESIKFQHNSSKRTVNHEDDDDEVSSKRSHINSSQNQFSHNVGDGGGSYDNVDSRRFHVDKFNKRRSHQSTNEQRYNRKISSSLISEKSKNQVSNNATKQDNGRQRFLSQRRNNDGVSRANKNRMDTMHQKRNAYLK